MGTHQIKWGDTLSHLAVRYGTSVDALARANGIANPDLIIAGNSLQIPGWNGQDGFDSAPARSGPTAASPDGGGGTFEGQTYDGRTPAPGTTDTAAWNSLNAPLQGSEANRNRQDYDAVTDQFAVGTNPRYAPRDGNTYCNIFASDVTRAMGAPIPHWVDANGNPAADFQGRELDANDTHAWLQQHGARQGWRQVSADEAQALANQGHPAVASWQNPGGIGHIGVVRPGQDTGNGPALAQAGSSNFNQGSVYDTFPRGETAFWVNDQGQVGSPEVASTSARTPATELSGSDAEVAQRVDQALAGTGLEGMGSVLVGQARQDRVPLDFVMAQLQKESSFLSPENNLSIANKNPGNLRWAEWEAQFGGQPGGPGNFTTFPSIEQGLRAQVHLLGTVYRTEVDNRDWGALISRYAPSFENDTGQYISQMESWTQLWQQRLGIDEGWARA